MGSPDDNYTTTYIFVVCNAAVSYRGVIGSLSVNFIVFGVSSVHLKNPKGSMSISFKSHFLILPSAAISICSAMNVLSTKDTYEVCTGKGETVLTPGTFPDSVDIVDLTLCWRFMELSITDAKIFTSMLLGEEITLDFQNLDPYSLGVENKIKSDGKSTFLHFNNQGVMSIQNWFDKRHLKTSLFETWEGVVWQIHNLKQIKLVQKVAEVGSRLKGTLTFQTYFFTKEPTNSNENSKKRV